MTPREARVVKSRLMLVKDLIDLADEKDREAAGLSEMYYRMATPTAVPLESKPPTESPVDMSSRYNEIFSDQLDLERQAKAYRAEAQGALDFIDSQDRWCRDLLSDAFVRGLRYKDMAESRQVGVTTISMQISRAIEDIPAEAAQAFRLL